MGKTKRVEVGICVFGEERKRRREATVERDPGRQKPESIFIPRRDNSQAVIKLVCHISFHRLGGLA